MKIQLDGFIDFLEASTDPISVIDQEAIFNIGAIEPFDCFRLRIDYNLSCDADLGVLHCLESRIENEDLCSDLDVFIKEVCFNNVGSFDPNDMHAVIDDKWVMDGVIDPELEMIEYIIRFQNTGPDMAFTVEIKSPLDIQLDWNSIKVTSFSHPYQYTITEDGYLNIVFNDIELPYEDIDEPASHGYISFIINKPDVLVDGNYILTNSEIYFDFNEPVITNEVLLAANIIENTNDFAFNNIVIAPNPISDFIQIQFEAITTGSINLYNALGKQIISEAVIEAADVKIDVRNLNAGEYFVEIQSGKRIGIYKLIKL